jgi:GrpB-like predicted nucleotidyltransferase (UPF0157 family)
MKVTIEPHNPSWILEFQKAKASLEKILKGLQYTSIEHVGSTSIPGLPAKPVIDIDIIIPLSSLASVRAALSDAGYFDCGEMNVPGRFAFRQPGFGRGDAAFGSHEGGEMRRNTYAMIEGCVALRNHLDIKRVLMEDKELREEYGRVKTELSQRDFTTVGDYVFGKLDILTKILRKAGWEEEDLEEVRRVNREGSVEYLSKLAKGENKGGSL